MRAIRAVLRKEIQTELRSRAGLLTAGMFAAVTVIALALAGFGLKVSGQLAAGILWVALLFAAVVSLPRSFVSEEEQGTADLLRMLAPPHAVFWGKALFNFLAMALTGLVLGTLYVGMAGFAVASWGAFALSLIGGCAALSGTVTLCGALVAQAAHRGMLAGAIALPLLIPFVFLGVAASRYSLGAGSAESGWTAILGVWLYAVATYALGPLWFAAVWKA